MLSSTNSISDRQAWWQIWCVSIFLCLAICSCSEKKEETKAPVEHAVKVKLKKLELQNVSSTVTLVGAMDSRSSVDLYPRIDGYVSKIAVNPGDLVKQGQLVIQIDSNKQEAAVAAKRSSVELAKADYSKELGKLGSLEADREARQSMVDFNSIEYQRYYWLEKRGVVATSTVDKEDRDLKVAKSRLASLEAEIAAQKDVIERAKKRIDEANAELRAEQAELTYHVMRAPFNGVVGNLPVKVGDYVTPATQLTKISKTKPLEINVEVPEDKAKMVHKGTALEILDNSGGSVGQSTVFYVAPTVNLQNQSVLIKGEYPNLNNELRPDESIQVRLVLKTEPALSVPTEAVSFVAGQPFVFVSQTSQDGKLIAKQRPIQISAIQDNTATVKSGLESGDQVIVSGIQLLSDNTPIEPGEDN